jgi:hypothetical protein
MGNDVNDRDGFGLDAVRPENNPEEFPWLSADPGPRSAPIHEDSEGQPLSKYFTDKSSEPEPMLNPHRGQAELDRQEAILTQNYEREREAQQRYNETIEYENELRYQVAQQQQQQAAWEQQQYQQQQAYNYGNYDTQPSQQLYDEMGNPVVMQPQQPQYTPEQMYQAANDAITDTVVRAEQAKEIRAAEDAISGFYEAHPNVYGSEQDNAIYNTVMSWNQAWSQMDEGTLDISDDEALEIAYEAARNPALARVLAQNPEYIDTDEGMRQARQEAGMPDELIEAVKYKKENSGLSGSIFG